MLRGPMPCPRPLTLAWAVALAAVVGGGVVLGGEVEAQPKKAAAAPKKKGYWKPAPKKPKPAPEEPEAKAGADEAKDDAGKESKGGGTEQVQKASTSSAGGPQVVETKSSGDAGVKTYKFGPVEVEGRLKSPQVVYFMRRVRAEFAAGALGHRSFMRELSDTRRSPEFK